MPIIHKVISYFRRDHTLQYWLQNVVLLYVGYREYTATLLRISYGDAAYELFEIFGREGFFISHDRYIGAWVQWLPILGIKASLPYHTIIYFYSMGVYLLSLLVIYGYRKWTKDMLGAWMLISCLYIGMCNAYFYYASTHWIGFSVSVLYILLTRKWIQTDPQFILPSTILFALISMGCNPFYIIPMLLGLGYLWIAFPSQYLLIWKNIAGLIIVVWIARSLQSHVGYDSSRIEIFQTNLLEHFQELDKAGFRQYFGYMYADSMMIKLLFATPLFLGLYYGKYWHILFGALTTIGSFYLCCTYFYQWESGAYMDLYARLIFLCALVCFYFIVVDTRVPSWLLSALFLFLLVFSYQKIDAHQIGYQRRIEYIQALIRVAERKDTDRLFVPDDIIDYSQLWLDWALGYETIVISRWGGQTKSIFTRNRVDFHCMPYTVDSLYSRFYTHPFRQINPRYFSISHKPYICL